MGVVRQTCQRIALLG